MAANEQKKSALDMFSMQGKVTVVTGGARGIGFALAGSCSEFGSNIALLDIVNNPNADLDEMQTKTGTKWRYYVVDVTDLKSLEAAFDNVMKDFGRIDNCIAAAGIALDKPFLNQTWDEVQRIFNINVLGVFFTAQLAASHIRAHNDGGSILLISSQTAHTTTPQEHTSSYGASKAAVKILAMHIGLELAPYNIRVNSISPGYIETEMGRAAAEANPAMKEIFEKAPPLGRRGQVDDLKGVVVWLLSGAGCWTTGTDVIVDGGLHGGGMHLRV